MAAETHELYGGKIILAFDPAKHRYTARKKTDPAPGRWVPSVTGIVGFMDNDKCGRLQGWAVKMDFLFVDEHLLIDAKKGALVQKGDKLVKLDEVSKLWLIQEAKKAHRNRTQHAADIGSFVHAWVEAHIKYQLGIGPKPKKPSNDQVISGVKAYLAWEKANKVEYVYSERKIYSLAHHYAGTVDIVARVNGKLSVVDIKTSNYMNVEFWLQTAGYVQALEEEFSEKFAERYVIRLDKESPVAEPHVASAEGRKQETDIETFLGLRTAYRNMKEAA